MQRVQIWRDRVDFPEPGGPVTKRGLVVEREREWVRVSKPKIFGWVDRFCLKTWVKFSIVPYTLFRVIFDSDSLTT